MNKRIRELWRRSVLNNTDTPMNWQLVADEFAQLIVRECAEKCVYVVDRQEILAHFGVEE